MADTPSSTSNLEATVRGPQPIRSLPKPDVPHRHVSPYPSPRPISSRSSSGSEILRIPARPPGITQDVGSTVSSPDSISYPVSPDGLEHALFVNPMKSINQSPTFPVDILQSSGEQPLGLTAIIAGQIRKQYVVHTKLLQDISPYLAKLLSNAATFSSPGRQTLTFPSLDEFAVGLFVRWIYGATLPGPTNFHTTHHYIALYCLALNFQILPLCNLVIDLVRTYYRKENMTAPAFRLRYVYENTAIEDTDPRDPDTQKIASARRTSMVLEQKKKNSLMELKWQRPPSCAMRRFLVATVAYRLLRDEKVSIVMRQFAEDGGEVAGDLMDALVHLHSDMSDPREGDDETWHDTYEVFEEQSL